MENMGLLGSLCVCERVIHFNHSCCLIPSVNEEEGRNGNVMNSSCNLLQLYSEVVLLQLVIQTRLNTPSTI